jgi:transposase
MTNLSSSATPTEWAAFVAIDWADQKHCWALTPTASEKVERGELNATPEAVEAWAAELNVRFSGRPIAVCLEQKRGALVFMLAKYAHLVIFPVHPKTAAQYRETFCPSGAKSDPADAGWLLDLLLRHRHQLRELRPDTPQTRLLQHLTEYRRCLVDESTRQKNRLTSCLKIYFPQLLHWFDDIGSPVAGALLERWPTLPELQRAHPGTLRRFFHQQNCRSEERIQARITGIAAAVTAVQDAAVVEAESLRARSLVALLTTLRSQIAVFDERIQEVVKNHPEERLFASFPSAGPVLVPRLIAAFGTQRDRYATATDLQSLSGIAPVTESSGKQEWVHFRWACSHFLRQTFHEYAAHSIVKSTWARAYYESQIEAKKTHHAAVRALAFKWIRIMFRCWKDGKTYDEQAYAAALRKRNSPLAALFKTTSIGWQSSAGFQRLSANPS